MCLAAYAYAAGIFPISLLCKDTKCAILLYAAGLVVKSGGEKGLKLLLSTRVFAKLNEATVDLLLFAFEVMTSMLAKCLILAVINSPRAVFVASVLTAVWELALRLLFNWLYHRKHQAARPRFIEMLQRLEDDAGLADVTLDEQARFV